MGRKTVLIGFAMLLAASQVSLHETHAAEALNATTAIEGSTWQLVELQGIHVSQRSGERGPFIKFDAEKKQATGFAGCNKFFGRYELNGAALKFGPVGSTRMSCPDLQLSLEGEFFKALQETGGWQLQDNTLQFLNGSEVLARFTEENFQEVTGPVWQWMRTLYNDDRKVVPADPRHYTLQFREDGTINVKADCNMKGGRYSMEQQHLSLEITHSTMAACPEDSLEDEFAQELSRAAVYFIEDGDLYLDLKYDSGTMRFRKQEEQ